MRPRLFDAFAALAVVVTLSTGVLPSAAQVFEGEPDPPPPFVTDRPTVGFAPVVVPPRLFQFELGYIFTRIGSGSSATERQVFPDLLARLGLTRTVEARLIASGWTIEDTAETRSTGFSDIALSTKIVLSEGGRIGTGLLFDLSLPVGSSGITSDELIPKGQFLVSASLGRGLDLVANVGATMVVEKIEAETRRSADLNYSAVVSGSLGRGIGVFGELYGFFPTSSSRDDAHDVQTGITVPVSRLVQVDLRAGAGLWEKEADWLVGAGVSFRVPR